MATVTAIDIQTIYVAYFNRPAEPTGLQFWLARANANGLANTVSELANSKEYTDAYAGKSPLAIVDQIYLNLFGRHAEPEGLTYWALKLQNGEKTFGQIAYTIANSAQNEDLVAINNKVAAAGIFTDSLKTAEAIRGYDGKEANVVAKDWLSTITDAASFTAGTAPAALATVSANVVIAHDGTLNSPQAFTLTTGVDAGTAFTGGAGNDTFSGNTSTLSALDQLDGGKGSDTLTLYGVDKDGSAAGPAGNLDLSLPTSVKNIETLTVVSTASALKGDAANVSSWAGLTQATFNVKGGVQTITAADTTAVTVANSGGGATVNGASKVTITSGGAAVANGGAASNAAGVAHTTTATAATTALNLKNATDAAAALVATADATADNSAGSTADLAGMKAAFAGAAGLTVADKATVAATTTDAGLRTAVATIVAANAAASTAAATAAAAAAAADTAGAVVATTNAALVSATVVGGTTVDIGDTAAGTLTTVSLDGNTGTATLTGDKLTTVSVAHTSSATNIVNTTAKHTLALGVNAVTGGATITDNAATTINLTVTGVKATTASNINLVANAVTALNVDTAAALTLIQTGLAGTDTLKALTVKGAGSLTANLSGVGSLTSVDLSAASGKHTLTLDGTVVAATIKGGSGVDNITTVGALDAKSTVALGAGNDTYSFNTVAAAGALVSGGDGSDTLAVSNGNLLDAAAAKVYSGFEVLEIGGGTGSYDMSVLGLTAVTYTGASLAGTATIANAAAGTTVGVVATASTDLVGTNNLIYSLKDATGKADAVTLTLNAVDGNNNGAANGTVKIANFTAAGIETVTIASAATADVADAVAATDAVAAKSYINIVSDLVLDSAKSLVITGAASTTITAIHSDTLTKIDASAATGNVTISGAVLATGGAAALGAVTYLGGSGVDTYTASGKGDVISGGAGADLITLGAGKDTLSLTKASDSILTLKDTSTPADGVSDTATGFDTITNFTTAEDKIDLSSMNIATGAARGSVTLHTLSADTASALQTAIGTGTGFFNDGIANRALSLLSVTGGVGYLFIDANGDGNYTAGTDAVIKLAGVASLVLTDVSFG